MFGFSLGHILLTLLIKSIEKQHILNGKIHRNVRQKINAKFLALVISAENHLHLPLCYLTLSMLYEKSLVGLSPLPNLRPLKYP